MKRFVVLSEVRAATGKAHVRLFDRETQRDLHVSGLTDDNGDFTDAVVLNTGCLLGGHTDLVGDDPEFPGVAEVVVRNDLIRGMLNEIVRLGRD